jgi:hypothetical protein
MNYARIALAAVVATIVDGLYGFLVYGTLLTPEFARYPAVYRSADAGMAYLPAMFACIFVALLVVAAIYAKGYEGGSGIAEGARFGVLFGVFVAALFGGVNYATLNIGRRISLELAAAAVVEWTLVGMAIGLAYRPAAGVLRRAPGV